MSKALTTGVIANSRRGFNPDSIPGLLFQGESLSPTQIISKIGNQTRPVQQGRAYLFDGTNDSVVIPNSTNYNRGSGTIVYKISFNTTQSGGANIYSIFDKRESSGDWTGINIGQLQSGTRAMRAQIFTDSGGGNVVATDTVGGWADGENHEVVVTVSPTTVTIEVDGTGTNSASLGAGVTDNTARPTLGATSPDNSSSYINWNGKIWGAEILVDGVSKGLWKCDEQAGATSYDSSGNENHGTITNATLSTFHSTQTAYSYQNQVGYNAIDSFVGNESYATLPIDLSSFSTGVVEFETITTDPFGIFISQAEGTNFPLAFGDGSTVNAVTLNSVITIDGSAFTGTRDALHTLIADGKRHTIRMTNVNFSSFTADGVSVALYSASNAYSLTGSIFNLKFDGNNNGTFDHVYLGYGETPWKDTVGSSDGVVTGVPEKLFIPRDESDITNDVLGNPLKYTGTAKLNANLEASSCVELNGTNQYGEILDTAGMINSNMSYGGYFEILAGNNNHALITKGINSQWMIMQEGQNLTVRIGSASTDLDYPIQSKDLGFKHVFATINGTTAKLYIDGLVVATGTVNAMPSANANIVQIGQFPAGSFSVDGKVAGVKVYNGTTLTDSEVLFVGTNGVSGVAPTATPTVDVPITETSGNISRDVSGNGNDITWVNAPTWSTQDLFHYNLTKGFNKYMVWDGDEDYVSIPIVTGSVTDATIEIRNVIPAGDTGILLTSGTSAANFLGAYDIGSSNLVVNIGSGSPTISVDGVAFSGNRGALHTLLSDGLPHTVRWANVDLTGWTGTIRAGWFSGSASFKFEGTMSDITFDLTSDGIVDHRYNGYGNTNADWIDQVGSVNGTVEGSPVPIRIPKLTSANTDVFGNALRNIPVIGHNDAETAIDFRSIAVGGNVPPEMQHLASSVNFTAFTFGRDTGWDTYDYAFYRQKDSVANDRFLIYAQNLTGSDLAKAEKYTNN